jgi:CRISPR/Cas system-associated protein Cas5 (RAMP superfamily)
LIRKKLIAAKRGARKILTMEKSFIKTKRMGDSENVINKEKITRG